MKRVIVAIGGLIVSCCLQAQPITRESLATVNSAYDELNPVLSHDGRLLFVTIANHPENVGGRRDPGDIWISTWLGKNWSSPVHGGSLINDRAYNGVAGITQEGDQLYLLGHYDPHGGAARSQGISVSTLTNNQWGRPVNIQIPYFLNRSAFSSGTFNSDFTVFVFSGDSYQTLGVDDLYVSIKENGVWSEPKNLGPVVNSKYQELTPSISADGQSLFFSSNIRKGSGSFDVYEAKRLDDSWTNWDVPVNIGTLVNSEGRELFYKQYGALGVSMFTSTKNSDGYGDLMVSRSDELPIPADTNATVVKKPDTTSTTELPVKTVVAKRPPGTQRVFGKVFNARTGKALEATIHFSGPSLPSQVFISAAPTGYSIDIPSTHHYAVRVEAAGFVSAFDKIELPDSTIRDIEQNFTLQPMEVGATVNLKNVLFVQAKTELLPESYDELDMVIEFLKTNPNVRIELAGHTDNRGVPDDNLKLSQERVNTVKTYMVSKGIESKRISGKGYGGTRPIADNDNEETRKMNRRVEFTIKRF